MCSAKCRGIRWRRQRDEELRLLALAFRSNVKALLERLESTRWYTSTFSHRDKNIYVLTCYSWGITMAPERFAMRLKSLRERKGLTQEELAEKAGVSRAYLSRLEIGRHDPPLSLLRKLAKALRVKAGRLVEWL